MSQELSCGYTASQSEYEEHILFLQNLNSLPGLNPDPCGDPIWNGGRVQYRLILEYAKQNPDINQSSLDTIINNVKSIYGSPQNDIGLIIDVIERDCANCQYENSSGWGFDWRNPPAEFENCIYGRIADQSSEGLGGRGGNGTFFFRSSNFQTQPIINTNLFVHELGHALGLHHTFEGFDVTLDHENVLQPGSCSCDCKLKGDLICDTPVHPYYPNDAFWNKRMYENMNEDFAFAYSNLDNLVDNCGDNFNLAPNQLNSIANYMGDQMNVQGITPLFTHGQIAFIKHWNSGKPWAIYALEEDEDIVMPGYTIENELNLINQRRVFNSDLVLRAPLKLKNSTILMANGAKIIIERNGKLSLDNAKIVRYDFDRCPNGNIPWGGIHVNSFTYISLKNGSEISGFAQDGIFANQKPCLISVYDNSLILASDNKNIFNLNGSFFDVKTKDSYLDGKILIQNSSGGLTSRNCFIENTDIRITNASLNLYNNQIRGTNGLNGSITNGSIIIQNSKLAGVNISDNNYIQGAINVTNSQGPTIIANTSRVSNISSAGLNNFIFKENDIYNNLGSSIQIISPKEILPSNIIHKNRFFDRYSNAILINSRNPNLAIECNDFINSPGTNLRILNRIAPMQGDNTFAAGNIFSRPPTNPEVFYDLSSLTFYHFKNQGSKEEPISINNPALFLKIDNLGSTLSKCDVNYPLIPEVNPPHCFNGVRDMGETGIDCGGPCQVSCPEIGIGDIGITPVYPAHCYNGILDGNEAGIDCGGSCPPCFTNHCNDGVLNGDETGLDCGGLDCPPCNTDYCSDGIQNNGETGVDCGGPCVACYVNSCNNGLWDGNETGVDCGGSCTPCTATCFDGIQNGEETGVDCGGGCPSCGGNCQDGIQNNGEYFVDCGGPCTPCIFDDFEELPDIDYSDFINELNLAYGSDTIPQGNDIEIETDLAFLNSLYDNGSTPTLLSFIENQSSSDPTLVYNTLIQASPNVSPKAFHVLFKKSHYYTEEQVLTLLKLNPGAIEDLYVYYVVFESESFSASNRDSLWSSLQNQDARTALNDKIRIKKLYMDYMITQSVMFQLQAKNINYNKIRNTYLKNNHDDVPYVIYNTYLNEGKYNQAWNYLTSINENEITDPYYKSQLEKYREVEQILMDHYYAGNKFVQIPAEKKQVLISTASTHHGLATIKARDILEELYSMSFGDFPENLHYHPLEFLISGQPRSKGLQECIVSPNPATSQINIQIIGFELPEILNSQIIIFSTTGERSLYQSIKSKNEVIDISNLISGVYIYEIQMNSGKAFRGKIVKIN